MGCIVQQPAPSFKSQAVMPDGSFKEVSLEDYRGQYVLLFFYPLDFTFVCPTELVAFNAKLADFEAMNTKVVACSVDSVTSPAT